MRSRTASSCAPTRPGTVAGESAAGVLLGIFLARRAEDPLARLLTADPDDVESDDVYSPAVRALARVAQEMRANPLLAGLPSHRANQLALEALHERALAALRDQSCEGSRSRPSTTPRTGRRGFRGRGAAP